MVLLPAPERPTSAVVWRLGAAGVREVDAAQLERAAQVVGGGRAGLLGGGGGVEDVEEAFRVRQRLVHLVVDAVELANRGRDVVEEQNVEHNRSDGDLPVEHEVRR